MKIATLDNATAIGVVFDGVLPPVAKVGKEVGPRGSGLNVVGSTTRVGEEVGLGTGVSVLGVGDDFPSDVAPDGWIASSNVVGAGDGGTPSVGVCVCKGVLAGAAVPGMLVSRSTAAQSTPPGFGSLPHSPSVLPTTRNWEPDRLEAMASARSKLDVPPYGASRTWSGGRKETTTRSSTYSNLSKRAKVLINLNVCGQERLAGTIAHLSHHATGEIIYSRGDTKAHRLGISSVK